MNFSQAKQIPISSYLASRGVQPTDVRGNQSWYCSPLRDERTPSFKVDTRLNAWYDHGTGQGGNLIDLIQALDGITSVEALRSLDQWQAAPISPRPAPVSFSFHQQPSAHAEPDREGVTIQTVKTLEHLALIAYLESRGIPVALGRKYLQECHYRVGGRSYYALGFRNDKGGYELRNKLWKGASTPKAVTTRLTGDRGTVAVFEGIFDFLSALVHFKKTEPAHSWIVLNSLSLLETVIPALSQYERVNLFLDNDEAGKKHVNVVRSACPPVTDYSTVYYPRHKDFNEFLTSTIP